MAISGGDGSIILTTNVDQSGLKKGLGSIKKFGATVGKSFLAIGAAAATATVAITKMATDAYADYEQMVGGIETLWGKSAKKIVEYANDAFYKAGQSANDYMRQVTLFSVALIRSTAGDTEKAADIANMAMIDIADNVARLGTDIKYVELAYQGFARNQYLLLDNLRIGYGGTREEMKRLLRDAEAITGVKYDITNLADVYTAIHVIQEELGIAGSAAQEAEKTITGSARMMKAAWQNVLSSIAGGGDLDRAINNLVYSIQKYFENIVPVVERSLQGIGQLIERVAPMLVQTVARSLINAIPSLLNAVYQMILGLANVIYQGIVERFKGGAKKAFEAQTNEIEQSVKNQNKLTKSVKDTEKAQKGALAGFDEINVLTESASENSEENSVFSGGGVVSPNLSMKQPKGEAISFGEFFSKLVNDIVELCLTALPKIPSMLASFLPQVTEGLVSIINGFADVAPVLVETILESLPSIIDSIVTVTLALTDKLPVIFETLIVALPKVIEKLTATFPTLFPAIFSAVVNLISILAENLDKIIQPIIDSIPMTLIVITKALTDNLPTIITSVINIIMALVNALPKILEGIVSAIPTVVELLTTALINNLPLIIMGLIKVVGGIIISLPKIFKSMIDAIVGVFVGIWRSLSNVFDGIGEWINKNVVKPVVDFFGKMWEGIKSGLKSFVNFFVDKINGMIGIYETFINFFIKGLNWFISKINTISFEVPEWVPLIGGKNLGFDIKQVKEVSLGRIPKLATGTVVPPNREFMAVLGDNKREPEIVSPLSTMKQAVAEVLSQMNIGGSVGSIEVPLYLNGREIARAVREAENDMGTQTNFGGFANVY